MNKPLPKTVSIDSRRGMLGYPAIRTLLPSVLLSLKKRLTLLFITNLFFFHQSLSLFDTDWQSLEVICSTKLICAPGNCCVYVGLPVPDIHRCTAQFVTIWEWGFIPKIHKKATKIHKELWTAVPLHRTALISSMSSEFWSTRLCNFKQPCSILKMAYNKLLFILF